jgi:hypothetical protein
VVVVPSGKPAAAEARVRAVGGTVEVAAGGLVQATVDPDELGRLAADASVRYVRPPLPHAVSSVKAQSAALSHIPAWGFNGYGGAGVKIAIVDLGFAGYQSAQASGDLPKSLTAVDDCDGGLTTGTNHGTAVAEIVHDIAPDAQLYLICIGSEVELAQAEAYAESQGVSIISHSVLWFDTSRGDGSGAPGSPDATVAKAQAAGILWVNAAGNQAQQHWSGSFIDTNLDGWNEFSGNDEGNAFFVGANSLACVTLKWDAWPTTTQDYDLYILRVSDNSLFAGSFNDQSAGGIPPTEDTCFFNNGPTQLFYAAIQKFSATMTPRFDLFVFGNAGPFQYETAAGSVVEPASSPAAMAVGAACWNGAGLEDFSSQGPTIDGTTKPDITGFDGVSTRTYGGGNTACTTGFFGTSAATPDVAAAAALVKQAHPGFSVGELRDFLQSNAVDEGPAGDDTQWGWGKLSIPLPPSVSGFEPLSGTIATPLVIHGDNLGHATGAKLNGVPLQITADSRTQITAKLPAASVSGPVTVTTGEGTATSAGSFNVTPTITGLSPSAATVGSHVRINGSGLAGATGVTFNGLSAGAPTILSPTSVQVAVPALATSGPVVVTLAGGGMATSPSPFTVRPSLTGFAPASGHWGDSVVLSGGGLGGATAVSFNGTNASSFHVDDPGHITATVPVGASIGFVSVTTPSGVVRSAAQFAVLPGIDDFSPHHDLPLAHVTITGKAFTGLTSVTFNGLRASARLLSPTSIDAVVPAAATSGPIAVTTRGGTATTAGDFAVMPKITSFSPASARVGTILNVSGGGFGGTTSVSINGVDAAFTIVSPASLRVTVPSQATDGPIRIQTPAGFALSSTSFKVLASVTGFAPASGPWGQSVTLNGGGLGGASAVSFNGTNALSFHVDNPGQITATVPDGATSGSVSVTMPSGVVHSSTQFSVLPTVDDYSTDSGLPLTHVTITGTGFTGLTAVKFNGVGATAHLLSPTSIDAVVPASATSGPIAVTTHGGTAAGASFAVLPVVQSFSPQTGKVGAVITVHGGGFGDVTGVSFGGTPATTFTVVSATLLHATVPAGAANGPIGVQTLAGPATSSTSFTVIP